MFCNFTLLVLLLSVLLIFAEQLEACQLELDRRREECIQLHSVLANQTKGLKSVANNNYSSHIDIINEDGELVLAFEAQKKINR
jgi:myosin-5